MAASAAQQPERAERTPERRCIVTRAVLPKARLVRFVVAPDRRIVADVEGRLPGRGLWLSARRDIVSRALAGRAFAKAARADVSAAEDLADRVEALLARRCRELLGLARRAGLAVAGFERVRAMLRQGEAALLIAARDGAADGRERLARLAGARPVVDCLTSAELGSVFGRDRTVHAGVARGKLADRILVEAGRLAGFREDATEGKLGPI